MKDKRQRRKNALWGGIEKGQRIHMRIDRKETAARLLKQDDILILCHRNPDGDTLGSGYGLHFALKQLGKRSRVLCSDPIPPKMEYLKGKESFSDFSPRFVVTVDIADEQLFGDALSSYRGKVDLAIDHHPSNSLFAKETLLHAEAAATCEIIYHLLLEMGVTVTQQIADCLYTGIATDTGCFKFANVTPDTHRIAASLIEIGCQFQQINKRLFQSKTLGMMELERQVLNTLEFHDENRIALICVSLQMLRETGVSEAELDGISGIPRQIEGVQVGVTIKERTQNEYKLSVRSSELLDASKFCALFGGGGHARAAGCTICGSLPQVREKVLTALQEALSQ